MNLTRYLSPVRVLLGLAVFCIGGAAAFAYLTGYYCYAPGAHMSGQILREHMILCIGVGLAVFVCASGAYLLLREVRRERFPSAAAALLFPVFTVLCAFVPGLIMSLSRGWWPFGFTGDSGWNLLIAPMLASPFLLALLIAFWIGLFACRRPKITC